MEEKGVEKGKHMHQMVLSGAVAADGVFQDLYKNIAVDPDYDIPEEKTDQNQKEFFVDREPKERLPEAEPE